MTPMQILGFPPVLEESSVAGGFDTHRCSQEPRLLLQALAAACGASFSAGAEPRRMAGEGDVVTTGMVVVFFFFFFPQCVCLLFG